MNEAETRDEYIDTALKAAGRRVPRVDPLDDYFPALTRMVAATSWLPHPDTVSALGGAGFPTSRARKSHPRFDLISENGAAVGMYDDNTTPRWALLWSHGMIQTHHPSSWTFGHVWESADDITTYTHLANLVMVPECFGSLTDKRGPLTAFLRWHAWDAYGWKPASVETPKRPAGYEQVSWRYLEKGSRPKESISERAAGLKNQHVRILRPIMQRLGML
jgi:hypothetical protein